MTTQLPAGFELDATPPLPRPRPEAGVSIPPLPRANPAGGPPPGFELDPLQPSVAPPVAALPQGFELDQPRDGPDNSVLGGSIARGYNATQMGADATMFMLGQLDPDTFVKQTEQNRKDLALYPKPPAQMQLEQDIVQADGVLGTAKALARNWDAIPSVIGESVAGMASGLGLGMAGGIAGGSTAGPPGAVIGTSLGLGAGAGLETFGQSFMEYIQKKGIRIDDPIQFRAALEDKDLVNEAGWYAAKKAGVSGAVNALGAQFGGNIGGRFFFPGSSLLSKGTGVAAELGVGAGTEIADSQGGNIATGQPIDPKDIVVDGALGAIMNLPQSVLPHHMGRRAEEQASAKRPPTKEEIDAALAAGTDPFAGQPDPTETPTPPPVAPPAPQPDPTIVPPPETDPAVPPIEAPPTTTPPVVAPPAPPVPPVQEPQVEVIPPAQPGPSGTAAQVTLKTGLQGAIETRDEALQAVAGFRSDIAKMRKKLKGLEMGSEEELQLQHKIAQYTRGMKNWQEQADLYNVHPELLRQDTRGALEKEKKRIESALELTQPGTPEYANLESKLGKLNQDFNDLGSMDFGHDAERAHPHWGALEKVVQVLNKFNRDFGITTPIDVSTWMGGSQKAYGHIQEAKGGNAYRIRINLDQHETADHIFATMVHEYGHMLKWEKLAKAGPGTQALIRQEYMKWKADPYNGQGNSRRNFFKNRDNAIAYVQREQAAGGSFDEEMSGRTEYWENYDEWFAEQVARWATTSEKALTRVDKFFKNLGHTIRAMVSRVKAAMGQDFNPTESMQAWLDSFIPDANIMAHLNNIDAQRSEDWNQRALRRAGMGEIDAAPVSAASLGIRTALDTLFTRAGIDLPEEYAAQVHSGPAMADKMNRFYEWMLSVFQVAKRNLHIQELQRYAEWIRGAETEKQEWMNLAQGVLGKWKKLGSGRAERLGQMLDGYMNMRYRTPKEINDKVQRKPTQQELMDLITKHNLDGEALGVFSEIVGSFDKMLDSYRDILLQEAMKLTDPIKQAEAIKSIDAQIRKMRKSPYFPAMRFGDYTVTIRDQQGNVLHFETAETRAEQKRIAKEAMKYYFPAMGADVYLGKMAKDARPMLGLPPGLLELIGQKMNLSQTQREALNELKFEYTPASSFKNRFARKHRVSGYSTDFQRAYANYFFHGANHITRVKFLDRLQGAIRGVKETAKFMPDGNKRMEIANFMGDHLQEWLDPKPDFVKLRGLAFVWALGFNPASAVLNLTQLPLATYPMLASRFGDLKAVQAMMRASAQISTYYKTGKLEQMSDPELQALSEAVKQGIINEAQASDLAGISEGRNLSKGFGGNAREKAYQAFGQSAAWLFQMAEQMNRRVTFRAAWNLARGDISGKAVQEALGRYDIQYQTLRNEGWTHEDAASYVTAVAAVDDTQFVMGRYARPKFMRGKAGTVFVFKNFTQNMLFMLWNHPSAAVRSMLVLGALGGAMGLPGTEDANDIIKTLGWQIFGKDFDVEREARRYIIDHFDGTVDPDILLHGLSRRGFGIPAVMDLLGNTAGLGDLNLPVVDMSKSIGMGNILPVQGADLLGPGVDPNKGIADTAQNAAGAAYGIGFNIYRALANSQLSWKDFKRWEQALPRAMGNVSKMYRAFAEGEERSQLGDQIISYDVTDPQQMAEAIGRGLGFQPLRLTAEWDRMKAQTEVATYWQTRREMLTRQFNAAVKAQDVEAKALLIESIRKFNADLPKEMKPYAITGDGLRQGAGASVKGGKMVEQLGARSRRDLPLTKEIQRLYPEATAIDARRVK